MQRISPRGFMIWSSCTAAVMILLTVALPHNEYIRYQQLASESRHYLRVKWIYERIHFDRTPIDVAFIGTSHTQSGIDDARVEEYLGKVGIKRHVVNFAIPHLGRDIEFIVARELLKNRQVRTLVIELQETEARAPHPGFQRLASVRDLLAAPLFLNTSLIENFARLPLRELRLALTSIAPSQSGFQAEFDPTQYEGPHWNDTYRLHGFAETRTKLQNRNDFEAERSRLIQEQQKKELLAQRFEQLPLRFNLLYRYNELYLQQIIDLASEKGVKVVFLYLPIFDGDRLPRAMNRLEALAPVLDTRQVLRSPSYWQNADHLNFFGAQVLSDWMGQRLAELESDAASGNTVRTAY